MLNSATPPIRGIVPVIPTPFTAGQDVDLDALAKLVEFACSSGVSAACLPAYGSEFYKLTDGERFAVVERAVLQARGRIQIVAQSNHPASRLAAEIARRNEALGADVISVAIPRQFALTEEDVLRYCETVAKAVTVPLLVQDFNPGGATIGAAFAARLHQSAGNFRYLKLEEPRMGPKVRAIREATGDRVAVLEGWGGMYLLELIPDGIAGAMPGLGMCDLFVRVFERASAGDWDSAFDTFRCMLPQVVFALQDMEMFHHAEKRLLLARSLLRSAVVREPRLALDSSSDAYIDFLNCRILAELKRQKLQ